MGRARALAEVVILLAVCAACGCEEPPPPAPPEPARAPVYRITARAAEHPYIAEYRRAVSLELRPGSADQLIEINSADTARAPTARLVLVASDRVGRAVVPLLLESGGLRREASRLRRLGRIVDARTGRAVLDALQAALRRVESASRDIQEAPFTFRRIERALEVAILVVEQAVDAPARAGTEHATDVADVLSLLFDAYPGPDERGAVEGVAVQLFRDLVAAARGGNAAPP